MTRLSPIVASTISIPGVSKLWIVKGRKLGGRCKKTRRRCRELQDKSEEWDTAEHHVRQMLKSGTDKKPHFCSVLNPSFLARASIQLSKGVEDFLSESKTKTVARLFFIFPPLLIGSGRGW